MKRSTSLQLGITMVETLVALVVLSVGLLGIAGLYVASVRANRTALIRTQAVNLVNDLEDRIRTNARARSAYVLATYGGAPATHNCEGSANAADNCTAAELAEDDLARWQTAVTTAFNGLTVTPDVQVVEAAAGFPDTYTVSVKWHEAGERVKFDDPTLVELNYTSVLRLIPVNP